jgi:hypothetical protein
VVISEQRDRWVADGSPPVPTLVVGGRAHVLQHPSQAAVLLGLESPPALRDAWHVAWDVDAIAEAWLEVADETAWPALLEPVPVLARTPLALTIDALVGIAALTEALTTGWFHWPGNPVTGELGDATLVAYEASIVGGIETRDDLLGFARPVVAGWRRAIGDREELLRGEPDRTMQAPRGDLTLVELLEAQRLHCAGHYRQATAAPGVVRSLDLASLHGLVLAEAIQ